MFRALSTRRSAAGYERLGAEPTTGDAVPEPQLARSRSVPARIFGFPKKAATEAGLPAAESLAKKSGKKGKSHPVFSLFEGRRKSSKKMTAKPELGRYMEYLKEGGRWDKDASTPVIYYNNNP